MSEELEISAWDTSGFVERLCQKNTLIAEGSCYFNCFLKIFCSLVDAFGLVAAWLIFSLIAMLVVQ